MHNEYIIHVTALVSFHLAKSEPSHDQLPNYKAIGLKTHAYIL